MASAATTTEADSMEAKVEEIKTITIDARNAVLLLSMSNIALQKEHFNLLQTAAMGAAFSEVITKLEEVGIKIQTQPVDSAAGDEQQQQQQQQQQQAPPPPPPPSSSTAGVGVGAGSVPAPAPAPASASAPTQPSDQIRHHPECRCNACRSESKTG